jgi:hypothetical protein
MHATVILIMNSCIESRGFPKNSLHFILAIHELYTRWLLAFGNNVHLFLLNDVQNLADIIRLYRKLNMLVFRMIRIEINALYY